MSTERRSLAMALLKPLAHYQRRLMSELITPDPEFSCTAHWRLLQPFQRSAINPPPWALRLHPASQSLFGVMFKRDTFFAVDLMPVEGHVNCPSLIFPLRIQRWHYTTPGVKGCVFLCMKFNHVLMLSCCFFSICKYSPIVII